jgi:hypothetical protein
MRLPLPELGMAGAPLTALLMWGDMPWYARLVVGLSGPVAYSFRAYLHYRLGDKAIDRSEPPRVPQVLSIATGSRSTQPEVEVENQAVARRRVRRRHGS